MYLSLIARIHLIFQDAGMQNISVVVL